MKRRRVVSLEEALRLVRDGLVTVEDAAVMLSISKRNAAEMVATGELRSLKIGNRRLIPKKEVELFMAEMLMRRAG